MHRVRCRWLASADVAVLTVLDLFSGIGGFSLGLERAGMTTVAFCEQDKFCQQVLAKHWPNVPCSPDIKELTGEQIEREIGAIDVVCGGYPCQPFSLAGERRGEEDDRHLWPEMRRIVVATRPTWVIAENVAGHINMGLDEVLSDLENEGYACWPLVIPACAVDARHRRDRVWIVAHDDSFKRRSDQGESNTGADRRHNAMGCGEDVAYTAGTQLHEAWGGDNNKGGQAIGPRSSGGNVADAKLKRQPGQGEPKQPVNPTAAADRETIEPLDDCGPQVWSVEPNVGRVAHGVPKRVDRLRSLGNAVVPQIPEIIGRAIIKASAWKARM
jgi:DNA (cytosine-5)-methyltransferase 1